MSLSLHHITTEGPALDIARRLFAEYTAELGVNLQFQGLTEELKNPLYKYGSPTGSLLLAYWDEQPVACVALQKLPGEAVCEMKRLYVQPSHRSHGIGDELVKAILQEAQHLGYTRMVLDTLERLQPAIRLYTRHGFYTTAAYYNNPLPGVVYMEKVLTGE